VSHVLESMRVSHVSERTLLNLYNRVAMRTEIASPAYVHR